MKALEIGPLVLPYTWFVGFLALAAGAALAHGLARRAGDEELEVRLFHVILVGLVAARCAFVARHWTIYQLAPLDIIDVRDGGFTPLAGAVLALAYALWLDRAAPRFRKPLVAAVTGASAIGFAGAAAIAHWPSPTVTLPALTLQGLDGRPVALADFLGKPVVLNLWATWCPTCQREMPALRRAQEEHPEVQFLFLDEGEAADPVRSYLSAQHFELRNVVLDARGEAAAHFGSHALPVTVFFDARGRMIDARFGALSAATLAEQLAQIPAGL